MKLKARIVGILGLIITLGLLAGCTSSDGLLISKAVIKSMDIESAESDIELTLNIKTEGLDIAQEDQQIIDMINNSSLKLIGKSDIKENKASFDGSVDVNGFALNGSVYTDGEKFWVKAPGEQKYILVDPQDIYPSLEEGLTYKDSLNLQKEIQPLARKFVKDYISEYKYIFNNITSKGTTTVTTPEGQKEVTLIEIKLDNDELQKFIKYTIENLINSQAVEEYFRSVATVYSKSLEDSMEGYDPSEVQQTFDEMFKELRKYSSSDIDQAVALVNQLVELGQEGITLVYGIDSEGNIVKSDARFNLIIKNPDDFSQKIDIVFDCKTTTYNINKTKVDFPAFSTNNVIKLKDYVKRNQMLKESYLGEMLGVQKKRIVLQIGKREAVRNGIASYLETEPYIENESTLVPVRFVGESLGAVIDWDDETRTVIYKTDEKTIVMQIGSKVAYVNDVEVEMPVAPLIKNNKTMVPLRFISEQFGAKVDWDDPTRTITIEKE